jgi:hypothetical protein
MIGNHVAPAAVNRAGRQGVARQYWSPMALTWSTSIGAPPAARAGRDNCDPFGCAAGPNCIAPLPARTAFAGYRIGEDQSGGYALVERKISASPPKPDICALMSTRPKKRTGPALVLVVNRDDRQAKKFKKQWTLPFAFKCWVGRKNQRVDLVTGKLTALEVVKITEAGGRLQSYARDCDALGLS